jgi:hypothetical protein
MDCIHQKANNIESFFSHKETFPLRKRGLGGFIGLLIRLSEVVNQYGGIQQN